MTEENQVEMRPAEATDMLTVVEHVYHQPSGEEATAVHSSFTRRLSVQEQPYTRKIKVGEAWQPLDLGWFADRPRDVGMIHLVNNEGRFPQTQPTEEERAAAASKIIVLSGEDDPNNGWLVYPGESFLGSPMSEVWLRCLSGVAQATVTVYPR